jgi:vancomycin resistance protein YoaR
MTTTTPDSIAIPDAPRRASARVRFLVAFLVGQLAAMALGIGAIYAYDQQYIGRVLPGVKVGAVDLSGMDPAAATEALTTEYAGLSEGAIVLLGPSGEITIPFADVDRHVDVDAMVALAMGTGRGGNPVERAIADTRTALHGVAVDPVVAFDVDAVAREIDAAIAGLTRKPIDAAVIRTAKGAFAIAPAIDGRRGIADEPIAAALAALSAVDAPARLEVDVPVEAVIPAVTTAEATEAMELAGRLTAPIVLAVDKKGKAQTISSKKLRSWTTFAPTADGGYAPTVDTEDVPATLKQLAKKIDKAPVNASFTTSGGSINGVTKSRNGHKLDIEATTAQVAALLAERSVGPVNLALEPTLQVTKPILTTAAAEAARPKMKRISRWTTYFPISEKNGQGANIWIPARLIDGYVVAPGATFDFWDAIGPVTRAKGYKSGGAIIDGRTEPQGALAGGICSCSTTLFNAALRAGYEMGARRNHYYYIDRYPLGLDATVFISASGSKQTMSFTNDTKYPLLIRGRGWREGGAGYVRFDLYSVPTGRKVSIQTGSRQNLRRATDTVQYTSSLRPGQAERIEYPVDGFQVTATRTVRDKKGNVIHKDTYYSNYARITGITLVGRSD